MAIKKDTLHPEGEPEIDIYPKTSIDQVENLQANLDALNGDIANISTNVETIANRVEIAENSITVLTMAYESYTDYTEVTNGFLLTYLSGRQIELPIKAGTNVTFSKYPGTNQIVINATGGSVPDNIALLDANNKWTGDNIFDGFSKSIRVNGLFQVSGDEELISATYNQVSYDGFNIAYMDGENQNIFHIGIDFENKARFGFDKYDGSSYNLYIPEKDGTIALLSDIPNTSSFPTLAGTNRWAGSNIFDNSITTNGNLFVSNGITSYTVNAITRKGYIYTFPDDTGTFALTKNIPTRPQYLQGFGIGTPTYFSFETGIYHTLTITLTDSYKSISIIIPNDYDGSQIDLDIDGDYFEVTLENGKLSVKNTTRDILWLGKLE